MTSYEELTEAQRNQVDALLWNARNNVLPGLEDYQEEYLREHISNLVQTVLYIEKTTQTPPKR